MADHKLPENWQNKDIREVIPECAVSSVSGFCSEVIRNSRKPGFDPNDIPNKAKALLLPHKQAFESIGTDVGFFAYWLQNAWNLGQFEAIITTLKKKFKKSIKIDDILPPEGISAAQNFVESCQKKTLVIEPGKTYLTLMFERVVEPYKDYIQKGFDRHGVNNLHYLALFLCNATKIPAHEYPF